MKKLFVNSMVCAAAIGSLTVLHHLTAQETDTPVVETTADEAANQSDAMKVCEDGFAATRAMHEARIAIFNGDTELCDQMLAKAHEALELVSKVEAVANVKTDLIPINGSLRLAETFVPDEQAAQHIAKANEHFQNGESAKGLEELKSGEIEVNFSRVLMPVEATKKRLVDAMNFAKEQKFYEANLALKSAEEGLEFDSIRLFEQPKTDAPSANG